MVRETDSIIILIKASDPSILIDGNDPAVFYIPVMALRLLFLVLLLASMSFPRTVPVDTPATPTTEISDSAALLGANQTNGASYGTFHEGTPSSPESEDTAVAAPAQDEDTQSKVIIVYCVCCANYSDMCIVSLVQPADEDSDETKKKTDDDDPLEGEQSWMENFRRFRRLTPYLWPSKSRTLQVFVVSS